MKDIIYLDTGVLHSFIAQYYDGLPTEISNHREEQITDENEKATGFNSKSSIEATLKTGNFEIPLIFQSPEGEFKAILQPGKFASEKALMSQTETGKEIITKQLHDNSIETFEQALQNKNELFSINDSGIEGKYIKHTSSFSIIDFKYLLKILQPEKLLEFMFIEYEQNYEQLKDVVSKEQDKQKKVNLKRQLNQTKKQMDVTKDTIKSQMDITKNLIEYLNDMLPTDAFLYTDHILAPLKAEFLRENANELMFKYGGENSNLEITMVGKVTRSVKSVEIPDFTKGNPLIDFQEIINPVMNSLGILKSGNLIISPVAIYFESD